MSGKLFVVGTPIGNLEDFSDRAKRILSEVDFIAAEDTRVTFKLLKAFDIKNETVSYFEHNKAQKGDYVISRILSGENCAIVTDAGMPAISDPGEDLVRQAYENGIAVESVPGPTAFATALSISGFPSKRFCFEGFLSTENSERKEHLSSLCAETRTMIFYEAPHKLRKTLADMLKFFGNRKIAVIKELTKLHENVFITDFEGAIEYFGDNEPRGEYVIIVNGAEKAIQNFTLEDAQNLAKELTEKGLSASAAAKQAAQITGFKKNEIYKFIIS